MRFFSKSYWKERFFNGAVQAHSWQTGMERAGSDLLLGKEKPVKGKNTVRKGKR
jgi:hypothetical protein